MVKKKGVIVDATVCLGIVELTFDKKGDYECIHSKDKYKLYENVKVLFDKKEEVIHIYKGKKEWSIISVEFYETAVKLIKAWRDSKPEGVLLHREKDAPVIVYNDTLGIMIAPRVSDEYAWGDFK